VKEGGYVVGVVGAADVIGRELRHALRERLFPISDLRLFGSAEDLAAVTEEDEVAMDLLDQAKLAGMDIVFISATETVAAEWAPRAVDARAVVIDLSQVFAEQPDVPIVVPEVNADAVADYGERGVITSPTPGAVAMSVILQPLANAGQLKRVVVTAMEPASTCGQAGIDELSSQTGALMTGRSVEATVFPYRMAFNLLPQVGQFLDNGGSQGERQVELQTARVLGIPDLPITVTGVQVPTFFGHGYAVNVAMEGPLESPEAAALLRDSPGVLLVDDVTSNAYPTLVDAVEGGAVCVGRIRDDPSVPYGLNLWVTVDGMRKGAALNAVQIAELLIRDYL